MIKLGKLTESIQNKRYPNNWITLAKMLGLEYEYDEKSPKHLTILTEKEAIYITDDNTVATDASLPTEVITKVITEVVKNEKTNSQKMGDLSGLTK